jgi:hypothetical protein
MCDVAVHDTRVTGNTGGSSDTVEPNTVNQRWSREETLILTLSWADVDPRRGT